MRLLLLSALALASMAACAEPPPLARLTLPPGFHIAVYTDQVPSAREMALGAKGAVFVGSMSAGKVYALTDGSLLVNDDQAGAIYRVTFGKGE